MAGGVSRAYESTWVYNAGGTRFEDRVGAILSRGINLQETFKAQALHTAKKAIAFENEQRNPSAGPVALEQSAAKTPPPVDMRGLTWVTKDGEILGAATEETFADMPPPPTPKQTLSTDSQKLMAHMTDTQRSMTMWKKVNPGCLESNTKLPNSTYTDHFAYQRWEPVNKERFRMKSDFTSYADQAIRYSQGAHHK